MAGWRLSRRACFGGEMPPTMGATHTPSGFATACRCSDTCKHSSYSWLSHMQPSKIDQAALRATLAAVQA